MSVVVTLVFELPADMTTDEERLVSAARRGNLARVRQLLAAGVKARLSSTFGGTPLHFAAMGGHLPVVEVLLETDLKAKRNDGAAAVDSRYPSAEQLPGAGVDVKDYLGCTPLHVAASHGQLAVVRLLLKKGANVHARDNHGNTALLKAVYLDCPAVAELLLEKGADVNAKNKHGTTALHSVCNLAVVGLLVKEGANMNAKNDLGVTPLHEAVRLRKKEVAYLLLEHGAFALIADDKRLTPLDYAVRPNSGEPDVALICNMLLPSGALVQLATDVVDAHEKRLTRIVKGLKRAVESPSFLEDLADTLAGVSDYAIMGVMLKALLRQLDLFAKAADDGAGEPEEPDRAAPKRRRLGDAYMERLKDLSERLKDRADTLAGIDAPGCARATGATLKALLRQLDVVTNEWDAFRLLKSCRLGEAYEERRGRHRLAVVQSRAFLSDLAEGLAGVNMQVIYPRATKKLVAAAAKLDALEAPEARRKRIEAGLRRAVENARFRSQLADTLAGIDASGCAAGTGAMLKALLRQLPAFAREEDGGPGAQAALRASGPRGVFGTGPPWWRRCGAGRSSRTSRRGWRASTCSRRMRPRRRSSWRPR